MKQPRIADFDPKAKERKLSSSMDNFPAIQKPPQSPISPQSTSSQIQKFSTPVPQYGGTPIRRKIKQRHPFDIYQDQYEKLRNISFGQIAQGGIGSMSAMVREAIDMYLVKREEK